MPYTPFIEQFRELALRETRSATALNFPGLPADQYGLIELYCDDENCDCRRVMFEVFSEKTGKCIAVVAYGWESSGFYAKWFGQDDPEEIKELQGPILNFGSQQSGLAPAALELVKTILEDRNYVARLKRHYQMFKEKVDARHFRKYAVSDVSRIANPTYENSNEKDVIPSSKKPGKRRRN
jgi:hypothetical protein